MSLTPIGDAYDELCEITKFYAGDELDFSFELVLDSESIPNSRLGGGDGARLGWSSWLGIQSSKKGTGRVTIDPGLLDLSKKNFGFDYKQASPQEVVDNLKNQRN